MHANSKPAFNAPAWQRPLGTKQTGLSRRTFLGRTMVAGASLTAASYELFPAEPTSSPDERERIEKAIPKQARVKPLKARKLLIFDLNVNYGGHPSIRAANLAFSLMGEKTGAWTTVVSRDPAVFKSSSLKQFDAVFFNNTVGNLFTDPELRQSLVDFVYGGGGLLGVHGTSVAFTRWPGAIEDWPEFGIMLGARGANHRDSDEHVFFKMDDPAHPLNQAFGGKPFDYRDEFFRVHGPYSRQRVRVLFSIDNEKTPTQGQPRGNPLREDNDYALAWVRQYGRGRTFYCTIAHNPYVFWDATMLQFYLGAIQFALGDLAAPTTPSARLTPAVRAQERLGWRLGMEAQFRPDASLFEMIEKAGELGLLYVGGDQSQKVSPSIPKELNAQLSSDELREIRLKLEAAGVRLLTYRVRKLPGLQETRELFQFARHLGIETIIYELAPSTLDFVSALSDKFDLKLAITDPYRPQTRADLQDLIKLCESYRIGVCGKMGDWMRSGLDPVEAIRLLKDRLFVLQIHDVNERTGKAQEVRWGTGAGKLNELFAEVNRLGLKPSLFTLDAATSPDITENINFFNKTSLALGAQK